MAWIIIIVVLVVAFGPVLWLMPSRRERRLAALRQRAYQDGMRVELRRLPQQNPAPEDRVTASGRALDLTRECTAYIYPFASRLRMLPKWRLLRGDAGLRAYPGWIFEPGGKPAHPRLQAMLDVLAPVIQALPADVIAVECEPQNLAAYWLEGPGTTPDRVSDLAARLAAGAGAVTDLDRRLRAEAEGGND